MNELNERVDNLENFVKAGFGREKVNALVVLCEQDLEKFVLLLEDEVFKNNRPYMNQLVDSRLYSQEHVNFIRECVFKHYEVPECLREFMWQALKECLNKRVREKQKKA
ncbi:hypothetical protein TELCIR_21178 [Teladorsagia circumcincta]|uniref:Uncharacterized protein n=1 Tax=Teladorsagia circumcincta TaxID=45464 RepID=A0A2G9THG9_TELCI|nr:hypothetical protein TELCIR_21178 [Teladorsagia circumcincta]